MTNVNQAPLPRLSKAPLVRASLVKRRYIKYPALPFFAGKYSAGDLRSGVLVSKCTFVKRVKFDSEVCVKS